MGRLQSVLGALDLCVCDCRHWQQTCWARPYHGAGFGEALVGPGCSQRGQTGMAAPLGSRCPGSSYWVLLAQLEDWNTCNLADGTGSLWGQHWLSSVLFSSRDTVNGRTDSTERLQSVKFRDALLGKWELGDGRVSLPSSPPSLGSFLANLKSSRILAGFFANNQCRGKNEIPPMDSGCIAGVSCSAWWGVVTREHGKTLWKHRQPVAALQAQGGLNKRHEGNYISICCKINYFKAPIY